MKEPISPTTDDPNLDARIEKTLRTAYADISVVEERRTKLRALRNENGIAFPNDFDRIHYAELLSQSQGHKTNEDFNLSPVSVSVAGRIMLKRVMGKASFATVQDMTGRIQLYITNDITGEAVHEAFKHWDMGDILGAEGTLFKTKTGELSIKVKSLRLLTKCLRPLPEIFHGLSDQEQKYSQRYLDLINN